MDLRTSWLAARGIKAASRRTALGLGLLVGVLIVSTVPVAAAVVPNGPDLTISIAGMAFDQIGPTDILWAPGETLTYTLTVRNTRQAVRLCEPAGDGTFKPICYTEFLGGNVSGVVVQDTLPGGIVFQSASGDSGFRCGLAAASSVSCSGGAIPEGGAAHISIVVIPPAASSVYTLTDTAVVDQAQTLDERSYANNSASLATTVWFCPPTCIN